MHAPQITRLGESLSLKHETPQISQRATSSCAPSPWLPAGSFCLSQFNNHSAMLVGRFIRAFQSHILSDVHLPCWLFQIFIFLTVFMIRRSCAFCPVLSFGLVFSVFFVAMKVSLHQLCSLPIRIFIEVPSESRTVRRRLLWVRNSGPPVSMSSRMVFSVFTIVVRSSN